MKKFILISLLVFAGGLSAHADAETVYQCVDGTRSFSVDKLQGKLVGTFVDFFGETTRYNCQRTGRGYRFKCTNDTETVAKVFRGADGRMMVEFELEGDFFPDSGYLYSLSCE